MSLGDYALSDTFGKTDTSNGRVHLRFTAHYKREFFYEAFLQTEFDQFRQLKSRDLGGGNLRQRWSRPGGQESFYSGYGAFYEYQVWKCECCHNEHLTATR